MGGKKPEVGKVRGRARWPALLLKKDRSTLSLDPEALEGKLTTGRIHSFDPPEADPPPEDLSDFGGFILSPL
jgi:hypothetical protein